MTFLEQVKLTIIKYNMLTEGDRILVGLSGGPDSVVLLHVLNTLKKEYSLEIVVAHLDHKFRGEESVEDRRFCVELAGEYNLEIVYEEIDVPKIAKEKGISPEEAARFERYDFFKRAAGKKGIKKIAVAHTQDDQAETVLMRIIRGAGMRGLGGMMPVKEMNGFTVIRPLIEVSRKEIEEYISLNKLEFRIDSSNAKSIFTRNRIRLEVMPFLEKDFNPNIKEVLVNMAENLRIENDFLSKYAMRKFKGMAKLKKGEVVIDIKRFKKQPTAVRKRILRQGLEEVKGDLRRFTYKHWKEIEDLLGSRPSGSIVDLPLGISIVKEKDSLRIFKT